MIVLPNPALGPMVNAVAAACRICRSVQRNLLAAGRLSKGDRSPVTIADYASQAIVADVLARTFPGIPLVAEEDSSLLRRPGNEAIRGMVVEAVRTEWFGAGEGAVLEAIDHGRGEPSPADLFFALDPIDGTKGFLRGEQYAVALALLEDGRPVAGVLGCPNLPGVHAGDGSLFVAVRGRGTYTLPIGAVPSVIIPVLVSEVTAPADIRFCESVETAHSHKDRSKIIAEALSVTAPPVSVDSQCKYGLVARGDAELYLRIPRDTSYREKIWDHAAGALILEEAGGRVTDLDGHPLDFSRGRELTVNRGIVASNGRVHAAVLEAVRKTE